MSTTPTRLFSLTQLTVLAALFIAGAVTLYAQHTYVVDKAEQAAQAAQVQRLVSQMGTHFYQAQLEWKNVQMHRNDPHALQDDLGALRLHQQEQRRVGRTLKGLLLDGQTRDTLTRTLSAVEMVDDSYAGSLKEFLSISEKYPPTDKSSDVLTLAASQNLSALQSAADTQAEKGSADLLNSARIDRIISILEMLAVLTMVTGGLAWIAHKLEKGLTASAERLQGLHQSLSAQTMRSSGTSAELAQQLPSSLDELVKTVVELESHAQMLAASIRQARTPNTESNPMQIPVELAAKQVIQRAMDRKP